MGGEYIKATLLTKMLLVKKNDRFVLQGWIDQIAYLRQTRSEQDSNWPHTHTHHILGIQLYIDCCVDDIFLSDVMVVAAQMAKTRSWHLEIIQLKRDR